MLTGAVTVRSPSAASDTAVERVGGAKVLGTAIEMSMLTAASTASIVNAMVYPPAVGYPEAPVVLMMMPVKTAVPMAPPMFLMFVLIPVATPVWDGGTAFTVTLVMAAGTAEALGDSSG